MSAVLPPPQLWQPKLSLQTLPNVRGRWSCLIEKHGSILRFKRSWENVILKYISTPDSVGVSVSRKKWRLDVWVAIISASKELIHFPLTSTERETVIQEWQETVLVSGVIGNDEDVASWEQRSPAKGGAFSPVLLPKRGAGPELLELMIFQEKLEIKIFICTLPFLNIGN